MHGCALSRGSRAMPSSVANGSHESDRLWAFESRIDGTGEQRKVVLGVDGGGTCTTCVCVAAPLPACADDLQWLSRVETGCSNYNSVGGRYSLSFSGLFVHYHRDRNCNNAQLKASCFSLRFLHCSFRA